MFREAAKLRNVYLPLMFWKVLRTLQYGSPYLQRKQYIDYVREKQPELFNDDMIYKRINN